MSLDKLQKNWEQFGEEDPFWAILTDPAKRGRRWDPDAFFRSGQNEVNHLMRYMHRRKIGVRPGKALDFGCGAGRLTQALAAHFEAVVGVDIAASMIELANQYNQHSGRVRYLHNPHPHLQLLDDETFDFIYTNITLQHIPGRHTRKYLQEFLRLLPAGGILVFQLPAGIRVRDGAGKWRWQGWMAQQIYRWGLDSLYRRLKYRKQPIMDMHLIPRTEVEALLREAGGELIHVAPDHSAGPLFESWKYFVQKGE